MLADARRGSTKQHSIAGSDVFFASNVRETPDSDWRSPGTDTTSVSSEVPASTDIDDMLRESASLASLEKEQKEEMKEMQREHERLEAESKQFAKELNASREAQRLLEDSLSKEEDAEHGSDKEPHQPSESMALFLQSAERKSFDIRSFPLLFTSALLLSFALLIHKSFPGRRLSSRRDHLFEQLLSASA